MKKWNLIEESETPDGKLMSLYVRDDVYTIRVDGIELMSTRQHFSEERLSEIACEHLKAGTASRVLIGGLGFGYSLKAALAVAPLDATICVVEMMAAVIGWNRHPEYPLAAQSLADPRVELIHADVIKILAASPERFDAIILDIDNGASALSASRNQYLYDRQGLIMTKAALRPGGCVGFWSVCEDGDFVRLMRSVGFAVEVKRVRARDTAGSKHTLFFGRV